MTIDIRRRKLAALLIATPVLLLLAPDINAQAPADPTLPPAPRTVNLTLEQRHTVKELLKDAKVQAVTGDAPMNIGDTVPERITVLPMPADVAQRVPQLKSHTFFIKDGHIVLVSPKDNKISDVID